MLEILQLPVLNDNYIYLIQDNGSGETAVIDPAEAAPVLSALKQKKWRLDYVYNTHHHGDHVGGNIELKSRTGCRIVGAKRDRNRIPGIDIEVEEGDRITLGSSKARILDVPGHTLGHIAYWFADSEALFCGDTLFALGCGRLFEGSAVQMWDSLSKFKALPPQTRVFCAHEYTQANGQFALTIDGDNAVLKERMEEVNRLRRNGLSTVPSTLAEEFSTNPFLRAGDRNIQKNLGLVGGDDVTVFAKMRKNKDRF